MRTMRRATFDVSGALVLVAIATCSASSSLAAPPAQCAACNIAAARTFLHSRKVLDCQADIPPAAEARFRARMDRCDRRSGCATAAATADAMLPVLQQAVEAVESAICGTGCPALGCGAGWGDHIDPSQVQGPVGLVPPAVDPAAAPSLADVAAFCRAHPTYDTPPPLLALPDTTALPEWCGEDEAYRQMIASCGEVRVVAVSADADSAVADGSVARPFATIGDAVGACGPGSCHILVGAGTYVESPYIPSCTFIEGGIGIADGVATRGAVRPQIEGSVGARGRAIGLARIDVRDTYGALHTDGDVLVSEAVLRGGYEGGSSAWMATGPRLCRTHVSGGYGGFDIAWHSSRLWMAGSAVSACYEGMALSWGSRGLKVIDSIAYGGYNAVGTSWGSVDVEVRGTRLGSDYAAVDIHIAPDEYDVFPATFDVSVTNNRIASGTLPDSNPALNIVIGDNVRE